MTSLVLQFNGAANELLTNLTRCRVKIQTRGGVGYLALRPSHRIAGFNLQARTAKAENGATLVDIPSSFLKDLKFPAPEVGSVFHFHDDGYHWFSLRPLPDDADDSTPQVTVVDPVILKTALSSAAPVEKPAKIEKPATEAKAPAAKKEAKPKTTTPAKAAKPKTEKPKTAKPKAEETETAEKPVAAKKTAAAKKTTASKKKTPAPEQVAAPEVQQADEAQKTAPEVSDTPNADEMLSRLQPGATFPYPDGLPGAKVAAKSTAAAVKKSATKTDDKPDNGDQNEAANS